MELASFLYLKRDPLHLTEKPYKLRYDPGGDQPRTNVTNETRVGIAIHDIRGKEDSSLETRGFTWAILKSALSNAEFFDEHKVQDVFYSEIRQLLQRLFDPKHIEIVEYRTRKRNETFPIATGETPDSKNLQPTTVVHLDYTPQAAEDLSASLLGVSRSQYRRVQCLNLWKPLRGPVKDWPLALCDPHTVSADTDVAAVDVVFRDSYTENTQYYFNPRQKWYFLSDQLDTEVTIFRQYDSVLPNGQGVPHSAFHIARNDGLAPPRESIEVRVFLYYE